MRKPKPSYNQFQAEQFSATIDNILKKAQESKNFEKKLAELREEADRTELFKRETLVKHRESYKTFLEAQRQAKRNQSLIERHERLRPGISGIFHGYPSIPVTPDLDKRQRMRTTQMEYKKTLKIQINEKQQRIRQFNSKTRNEEMRMIEDDNKALQDYKSSKLLEKEMQRKTLVAFWEKDKELKKLAMM